MSRRKVTVPSVEAAVAVPSVAEVQPITSGGAPAEMATAATRTLKL